MGKSNKTGPDPTTSDASDIAASQSTTPPENKESGGAGPQMADSRESLEDYGEPLKFDPNFSGPIKKRTCTGILQFTGFYYPST